MYKLQSDYHNLRRFSKIRNTRNYNRDIIIKKLTQDKRWSNQFEFVKIASDVKPSFMNMPILLNKNLLIKKKFSYINSKNWV